MPSVNKDSFISSFQFIYFVFLFLFFCIIVSVKISSTKLKSSGERRYPCLISDLSGNALSFSPFVGMLAVCFCNSLYQVENVLLYSEATESLHHEWVSDFVKWFCRTYWYGYMIFLFLVCWCDGSYNWFLNVELALCNWNKFHLVMVYNSCYILLDLIC